MKKIMVFACAACCMSFTSAFADVDETSVETINEPVEQTVAEPIEAPVEETVAEPVEEVPEEQPVAEPAPVPVKPAKKPVARKAAKTTTTAPVEQPGDESYMKSARVKDRTPCEWYTPFALTLGGISLPYSKGWDVSGIRINLNLPFWHARHENVFGIDVGLSGECMQDMGGIAINFLNNHSRDFCGLQIGGLYNITDGNAPFAIQIGGLYNHALSLSGWQTSFIWNEAKELRGLQIGLLNFAESGRGLQIGLWNVSGSGRQSPIIGLVF